MVDSLMQSRHYIDDNFVWSWSTLIACITGQWVHWLSSYGRARRISKTMKTEMPGVWLYWSADWPTTLAAFLTVSVGYFFIPQIGLVYPKIGLALGVVAENGELLGLNMLSAFLWGVFGAMVADMFGRRMAKLVE